MFNFVATPSNHTLQTLFLQHPPVGLCPLKCDLREPAHCRALVIEVVLADVHDGDLLRNVFDGGGVGEGRAHQLCHPLHSVGLERRFYMTSVLDIKYVLLNVTILRICKCENIC